MKQRKFVELILIIVICSSCNLLFDVKDEAKFVQCKSLNCFDLKIDGSVLNEVTNNSVYNMPIALNWVSPSGVIFPDNTIDISYSNDSGKFSFTNAIDTSYFSRGFHLNISIPVKNDFIIFPKGNIFSFYNPADSTLKNLKFRLYPRTQLLIQLVREKTDAFETFMVGHSFSNELGYTDRIIQKSSNQYDHPLNDSFNVETAADTKTYITWTKITNSVRAIQTDSIVCKPNIVNSYKIKY